MCRIYYHRHRVNNLEIPMEHLEEKMGREGLFDSYSNTDRQTERQADAYSTSVLFNIICEFVDIFG